MMLTTVVLSFWLAQAAPPPPPSPVPPRRDATTSARKGTAIVRGRVIAAEGERPLRRAQVRLVTSDAPEPRVASTNAQGAYEIRDVPAGRYRVSVTRSGYLPMQYGQRRPEEAAIPLEVADGQVVEKIDFALSRTGVISGRVTDETGDAVAGVTVWAMQPRFYRGRRRLTPAGSARTDDTGQYRLLALAPGDYAIMGLLRETWVSRGKEKVVLAYAPSYFPTTASAGDAQRVRVGVGQEVAAVDFSLVPGRAAKLSGTATRADGSPLPAASISLSQKIMGPTGGMVSSIGGTRAAADGTWTLPDVAPGEYEIEASSSDPAHAGERATGMLTVAGVDLDGVALVAGAAATITGRVVTESGKPLPGGWTLRRVGAESVVPDGPEVQYVTGDPNGLLGADGSFELTKVPPGRVMLRTFPPSGWAIARVQIGGQDFSEIPLDVRNGDRIDGVRIVLTDRFPTFTGRIVDDDDQPVHGTVLLFPDDPAKWHAAAGTLRVARPDQAGTFKIDAVRPGRYLLSALEFVAEWQVNDPEFLADLRERATKLTIAENPPEPIVVKVQKATR